MNRWSKWIAAGCVLGLAVAVLPASPAAAQADKARLDKAFQAVRTWDYGQNAGELQYVASLAVEAGKNPALRKNLEDRIIAAVEGEGTKPGKAFLCRQLVIVGTQKSIPALAKLLADRDLSHMGRYALERIPGAAADEALRKALAVVEDRLKVGMIYSLGRRGCEAAADDLIKLLDSKTEDVVCASLIALSRLHSAKAVEAIARARRPAPGKLKGIANNAYLDCAARLAASGKTAEAVAIYEELFRPGETWTCRVAALKGLVAVQGDKAVVLAIAALSDKDPRVRQVAIPTLRDVPGEATTKAIAAQLARQDPKAQAMLLLVLVDRGDRSALPEVIQAVGSRDEDVRIAALEALGKLGDASVVPTLAAKAVAAAGKERDAARASLDRLPGEGVNAAMVKQMASADAKARVELVRSLGARKAGDCVAAVLKAAEDRSAEVRAEAIKALRILAEAKHVPVLLGLLVETTDANQRAEVERTVVAAARKADDNQAPAKSALAALTRATTPAARAALVRVLGKVAHKSALPSLYTAAKDSSAEVQDAAIRALSAWPDAAPAQMLWQIVRDAARKETDRVIAFRGYVEMIPRHTQATDAAILKMYAGALSTAWRKEEKQLVLSKLGGVRHERALELAKGCLDDPALKAAAQAAVKKIEKLLASPASATASHNPHEVYNALDGNAGTRWSTGLPMQGGEWFKLDLGRAQLVSGITLDARQSAGDYPRGYEVYVSPNMLGEGKLAAKGQGRRSVTDIRWKPVAGRTIKIVQTGKADGLFWSIHELKVRSKPIPR